MAHTPGPWALIDEPRNHHYRAAHPGDYEVLGQHCWYIAGRHGNSDFVADVITTNLPPEEGDANAKLLAAAPDLLDACEEMLAILVGSASVDTILAEGGLFDRAFTAIAKAKGQQITPGYRD